MRITTGIVGGREIAVPKSDLRPTQDKVRQALFSSLGESIVGARVLDLFAGSGSVGLEAWSRGAEFVCFVEQDFRGVEAIKRNIESFKIPAAAVQVIRADAEKFLARPMIATPFDLVFADPPYRRSEVRGQRSETGKSDRLKAAPQTGWGEKVLSLVETGSILRANGILIFEQGDDEAVCEAAGWEMLRERRYGSTRLVFYRFLKPET